MATNVYKTITSVDANNRTIKQLTPTKKQKVITIVSNFITYLKAAHS